MTSAYRALILPAVATIAMFAILVGLGVWQVRRLGWKEALIARVEQRYGEAPTALPPRSEWASMQAPDYEYRAVRVSGRYDTGGDALIYAVAPEGFGSEPGFTVVTPFRLETGGVVLVERGFLPQAKAKDASRRAPPPGDLTLTGRMRAPQARGGFTPPDDPVRNIWFTRDPTAMAAALRLDNVAPFTIALDDAGAAGPDDPRPFAEKPTFPNNHLSYALTWFSLALADIVIFVFYARGQLAQSRGVD